MARDWWEIVFIEYIIEIHFMHAHIRTANVHTYITKPIVCACRARKNKTGLGDYYFC